jgi:hypothetical protein
MGHGSHDGYTIGQMDIDRRLDKLAERQAALHRRVQCLAEDQRKGSERRTAAFEGYEAAMAKNQVLLSQILESIDRAARSANTRGKRNTGSESRPQ